MRRKSGWLLVGFVIVASATAQAANSRQFRNATAFYQLGERALLSGNLPRARSNFEKALKVFPGFPEAHMGLGHIAMGEHRFDDALREYERAAADYEGVGSSMFELEAERYAMAQDQMAQLRSERLEIERMLRQSVIQPTAADMRLGKIEAEIHNLEGIVRPGQESSKVDTPPELSFHIGNALFRLERLDDAITAWEECTRRKPDFAIVHNNLAVAYWRKGRIEAANASLARAASLGLPINPEFKADLERTLLARSVELP